MNTLEQFLAHYPNILNESWPASLDCVRESQIADAKNAFQRTCFKDFIIHDVVPVKRDSRPSCAWRVFYKVKDRTPVTEANNKDNLCIYPFHNHDEELVDWFNNITFIYPDRLRVSKKYYTVDNVFLIVEYTPIADCACPGQDFNLITKVSMNLHDLTL